MKKTKSALFALALCAVFQAYGEYSFSTMSNNTLLTTTLVPDGSALMTKGILVREGLTDGTNSIDAAGNVYKATWVLSDWIQTAGPSDTYEVFWVENPGEYSLENKCWALRSEKLKLSAVECTRDFNSTNFTVRTVTKIN